MLNFERKIFPEERLTPEEKFVYEEMVEKEKTIKPKEENFSDIYSEFEIKKDIQEIKNLKVDFDFPTPKSKILEQVLLEQIEMSNWTGNNCYTVETTKYDDIINHTDFIIEWEKDDEQPVRLAVDVTVNNGISVFDKKYQHIKKELDKNRGTTIKYFNSEINPEEKGTITNIPRVIIALDKKNLASLCEIVSRVIRKKPGSNEELSKSPLQLSVIKEIIFQLNKQAEYLERQNKTESNIFKNLIKVKENLIDIYKNKKSSTRAENLGGAMIVINVDPRFY